jgi:hypothetical protein
MEPRKKSLTAVTSGKSGRNFGSDDIERVCCIT